MNTINKKIERYVYIWDIHWNKNILNIFNKYNDWKTKFILLGDLFDRWNSSFEIIIKIQELYNKWILNWVLWNHDLFFIFTYLKNYSSDIYRNQLLLNGWKSTIKSFRKNVQYRWNYIHNDILKFCIDISKWLLENFNLYHIDELNNISIHWWIPVFFDWNIIWDIYDNTFIYWIEYIKKLNKLIKLKDTQTINNFTALNNTKEILTNNKNYYNTKYDNSFINDYSWFIPTWYRNKEYINNIDIQTSIIKELDNNWLKKLIVWHDFADNTNNNIQNRIFRIDMQCWILVKDRYNKVLEFFTI